MGRIVRSPDLLHVGGALLGEQLFKGRCGAALMVVWKEVGNAKECSL